MTRAVLTCLACLTLAEIGLADPTPSTQPANIRETMQSIWHEAITPPPSDKQTADLGRAVRQLRAMAQSKAKAYPATPIQSGKKTSPVAENVSTAKGAPASPIVSPTTQPGTQPATQPASRTGVSAKELELLKSMAVEELANAASVANKLYRDRNYEAALAIYMRLQANPPKNVSGDWILLQLANCHGWCGNYAQAVSSYQKLISGFPQSPWVAVAKIQVQVATWRQEVKPSEMLKLDDTDE